MKGAWRTRHISRLCCDNTLDLTKYQSIYEFYYVQNPLTKTKMHISLTICIDPTEPFTTFDLQNPSHGVSALYKIRRSPDLKRSKIEKGTVWHSVNWISKQRFKFYGRLRHHLSNAKKKSTCHHFGAIDVREEDEELQFFCPKETTF